ncbi:MAG TPA: hypothetical protein VGW38_20145 [Chloroflexota bacterium]|nr:hypothetical protein [Chloroflexota bacterium]
MRKQILMTARLATILAITAASFGCQTAQGAREDVAEAATTIGNVVEAVFTDQGAEAVVQGSIADVDRRTRAVLREMGLTLAEAEYDDNATEREYEARGGDRVVHVELEARSATTTEIEVSYRVGETNYEKEQAREIIRRIQQRR